MALYINGTGQDSFSINGVSIDNLYVDNGGGNVLVWSSVQEVALFEMYVTSTSRPSVNSIPLCTVVEESPNYWRVYNTEAVTYIKFDYFDSSMRTAVTKIHVTKGDTLTNLQESFYMLNALTDFEWTGACNATSMYYTFGFANSLVNLQLFDTSAVTNFERAWDGCNSLVNFPAFDTSATLTLRYAWNGCSSMESFPAIDTPLCTNFEFTWSHCEALTEFPTINTISGRYFNATFASCYSLICMGAINTTIEVDTLNMFLDCNALVAPNATDQALIEAGYNWVNPIPCSAEPPIYELTETLIQKQYNGETYWYVDNSSSSGDIFDGRLEHIGDGSKAEGAPWEPNSTTYPGTGVIDLTIQGDGFGSRRIMTAWTPPLSTQWSVSAIYDVIMGSSYSIYAINYLGNNEIDIYLGSNTEDVAIAYSGVAYIPQTTEWVITEDAPSIIYPNNLVYNMNSFITI